MQSFLTPFLWLDVTGSCKTSIWYLKVQRWQYKKNPYGVPLTSLGRPWEGIHSLSLPRKAVPSHALPKRGGYAHSYSQSFRMLRPLKWHFVYIHIYIQLNKKYTIYNIQLKEIIYNIQYTIKSKSIQYTIYNIQPKTLYGPPCTLVVTYSTTLIKLYGLILNNRLRYDHGSPNRWILIIKCHTYCYFILYFV